MSIMPFDLWNSVIWDFLNDTDHGIIRRVSKKLFNIDKEYTMSWTLCSTTKDLAFWALQLKHWPKKLIKLSKIIGFDDIELLSLCLDKCDGVANELPEMYLTNEHQLSNLLHAYVNSGYPMTTYFIKYAAYHGYVDCMKYAHEHGCPWHLCTTSMAVLKNNFECLEYAHKHGCPWDKHVIRFARHKNYIKCLTYAIEHGCPDVE